MKRKKKSKGILVKILVIFLLMIVPSFIFYLVVTDYFAPKDVGSDECLAGEVISPYCEGQGSKMIFEKICSDGRWTKQQVTACSDSEQCAFGQCFSNECEGALSPYCINDFELVTPYCDNGELMFLREICGEKTPFSEIKGFCRDGTCYLQPPSCGNGICETEEDSGSCYRDCSVINSADAFAKSISINMEELYPYLQCDDEFECDSTNMIRLADSIMNDYNIPDGNPQMYMDAVVDYVNEYIIYHFGGGAAQCGESASDILNTAWGNCVDYSVLTVTLLRVKGIPARQIAGCVSHVGWFCHTFALRDTSRLGGVPILWDSTVQQEATNDQVVGGDVLGHSWVEVWLGPTQGWVIADPTVGDTISKKCVGYYPVYYGGTGKFHNDCEGDLGQGPCYHYAYCHIDGKDALEYCKTF